MLQDIFNLIINTVAGMLGGLLLLRFWMSWPATVAGPVLERDVDTVQNGSARIDRSAMSAIAPPIDDDARRSGYPRSRPPRCS